MKELYPIIQTEALLLGLAKSIIISKSLFSYHTQIIANQPYLPWSKVSQFTDTDSYMYSRFTFKKK